MKIQHEWADARIKGDSSYTRRIEADDCTFVWPDGRIVNKRQDLQTMTGDIVFSEFKIQYLQVRLYDDAGIVVGEGIIKAHKGKQDLLGGKNQRAERKTRSSRRKIRVDRHICEAELSMEGGRFTNHSSLGKMIAHSYPSLS